MNELLKTEAVGDLSHQYRVAIIEQKHNIETSFLELAHLLYEVKTDEIYLVDCESFEEYLADPEIDIGKTRGFSLAAIYKRFVVELECDMALMAKVGVTKLGLLLEKITLTEENVDEWLHTAAASSKRDFLITAGVTADVDFDGFLRATVMQDEAGRLIRVESAPDILPKGTYRESKTGLPVGEVEVVAKIKGKVE